MHVYEPLPAHLRTVGHAGEHVFACELRVLFQDLFDGETQVEQVQYERYPDAVPTDAGLAEAYSGVYGDPLQQLLAFHVPPKPGC